MVVVGATGVVGVGVGAVVAVGVAGVVAGVVGVGVVVAVGVGAVVAVGVAVVVAVGVAVVVVVGVGVGVAVGMSLTTLIESAKAAHERNDAVMEFIRIANPRVILELCVLLEKCKDALCDTEASGKHHDAFEAIQRFEESR